MRSVYFYFVDHLVKVEDFQSFDCETSTNTLNRMYLQKNAGCSGRICSVKFNVNIISFCLDITQT